MRPVVDLNEDRVHNGMGDRSVFFKKLNAVIGKLSRHLEDLSDLSAFVRPDPVLQLYGLLPDYLIPRPAGPFYAFIGFNDNICFHIRDGDGVRGVIEDEGEYFLALFEIVFSFFQLAMGVMELE